MGYDESDAVITFNGQTIQNGVAIEITEGGFTLTSTGAVPADLTGSSIRSSSDDGMALTDYLLIILIVIIVILAIMVVLRLMRS